MSLLSTFDNRFAVIAHRGFSARYPDNSLEAFDAAIRVGADCIETDVRISRGGVIVCAHDPIAEGNRDILALSDVFLCVDKRVPLLLDIKSEEAQALVEILDFVTDSGHESNVILGVRSVMHAQAVRKINFDVPLLGFIPLSETNDFYSAGGNIVRLWEKDTSAENVILAQGKKKSPVWVMTGFYPETKMGIGDVTAERLGSILKSGASGVLVNDPETAIRILRT